MTMTDNTTKEIMTDYKLDEYAADCAKQILEEINTHGGDEYVKPKTAKHSLKM